MSVRAADDFAKAMQVIGDQLLEVLDEGDVDEHSRYVLAHIYRAMTTSSAKALELTDGGARTSDPDVAHYRRAQLAGWCSPFGVLTLWRMVDSSNYSLNHHLYDAEVFTVFDLERLSDDELRALKGVGPKSIAWVRSALDVFFWRGEVQDSAAAWQRVLDWARWCLQDGVGSPEFKRQRQELADIAAQALATKGRSLSLPAGR